MSRSVLDSRRYKSIKVAVGGVGGEEGGSLCEQIRP